MVPLLSILAAVVIVGVLAVDLGIHQREPHAVTLKRAIAWSALWIALGLAFNVVVYFTLGGTPAVQFLSSYLVEKSLSVDNLFVFLLIFSYFQVPREHQHKVLFWGIVGAVIFRAALIYAGIQLIEKYHWLTYFLGAFLVFTGFKTFGKIDDDQIDLDQKWVLKLLRRSLPVSTEYVGNKFLVKRLGKWFVTPLFVVLVMIETTDILFAVDSIPAILGITRDPFILMTSNLFAILGLRALYFVLESMMRSFRFLSTGVSLILMFVGTKMVVADLYHLREGYTLAVILFILTASVGLSLRFPLPAAEDTAPTPPAP